LWTFSKVLTSVIAYLSLKKMQWHSQVPVDVEVKSMLWSSMAETRSSRWRVLF